MPLMPVPRGRFGPVPCAMCAGDRRVTVREATDYYRAFGPPYRLTKCRDCGHVMQNPPPTRAELDEAYSVAYDLYRPAWQESGRPFWRVLRDATTQRRLRRLVRHGSGRSLLEVGCGAGDFLLAARGNRWSVCGVEYNSELAELVSTRAGIDVRGGELTADLFAGDHFDVVVLWNVLEHLDEPHKTMRIVAERLGPGGVVLMSLPTVDAAECGQRFGERWALLDLPRHLHFFDRAGIDKLCRDTGFALTVYRTPLRETAWCYVTSGLREVRRESGWRKAARALGYGALAVVGAPVMALRCRGGHGMEAFAVAVRN